MQLRFSHYSALLLKYLRPQWLKVFLMAITLLGSIGLELLGPQIQGQFIHLVEIKADNSTLTTLAIVLLAVLLFSQLVSASAAYFSSDVGMTATNTLSEDLSLHCLKLDLGFHKTRTPGELLERIDGDVGMLANFFSQFIVRVVGNGLLMLGILIYMLVVSIWIGLALIGYTVLVIVVMAYLQKLSVPFFIRSRQASAELTSFYEEHMHGVEDLISSGAGAYVVRRYVDIQRRLNNVDLQGGLLGQMQVVSINFLLALAETIVLTLGAYLFTGKLIDMGVIFVLLSYVNIFSSQLINFTDQLGEMQQAQASLKRIAELYYMEGKIQDGPGIALPHGPVSVTFEHVSFGYDEGQQVLSEVDFQLEPGELLGLIGRSGSGKTSMTRLLFRFYDPIEGTIRLDGQDIRQARIGELRERIGLVTQEVQLFKASLRDNLTFFNHTISDERLLTVIEELGLGTWFRALPEGLETELAPGGSGLSAGEAQLLALVRVFLKDPCLVILDEASSRLDMATERVYMQATQRLLQNRTGIVIAHRLATVEHVDKILVLEEGRVVEYGQRAQLAQDLKSRYSTLLRTMNLEESLA